MQTTSSHDPMHTLYYFAGNGTDRGSAMALHGSRWCLWCLSVGSFGPLGFKRMQESLATQLRWGSHLLMPRLRKLLLPGVCVYVCVCVCACLGYLLAGSRPRQTTTGASHSASNRPLEGFIQLLGFDVGLQKLLQHAAVTDCYAECT